MHDLTINRREIADKRTSRLFLQIYSPYNEKIGVRLHRFYWWIDESDQPVTASHLHSFNCVVLSFCSVLVPLGSLNLPPMLALQNEIVQSNINKYGPHFSLCKAAANAFVVFNYNDKGVWHLYGVHVKNLKDHISYFASRIFETISKS